MALARDSITGCALQAFIMKAFDMKQLMARVRAAAIYLYWFAATLLRSIRALLMRISQR
jgi:hypothetical protein